MHCLLKRLVCCIAVCAAPLPSSSVSAQAGSDPPGKVVGLAFVGRMVADLDASVAFYTALGFSADPGAATAWHRDPTIDRLLGARGLQVRSAQLSILNAASGRPFKLDLWQLRGIERRALAGHPPWALGSTHFSIVVADAPALWGQLQASGQLRARSWGARLIAPPGQTLGRIAYLTDPDGLDIELLNQRPGAPAGPGADPDTVPGVGHAGLVVRDLAAAQAFYGALLGARPQTGPAPWLKGDFFDSVVGGHGNVMRVFDETFAQAAAPEARVNFALIEFQNRKDSVAPFRVTDIGVGYVGFEVQDLDGLLQRALAGGARLVSAGAPVTGRDGTRAVMLRDPDVGGFLELLERPRPLSAQPQAGAGTRVSSVISEGTPKRLGGPQ